MSGRGDNNKKGSAGRGAANQSNQGFGQAANRDKSYHGPQTGGQRSEPQRKQQEQSSNRNTSTDRRAD
jgi:hypothetical protein